MKAVLLTVAHLVSGLLVLGIAAEVAAQQDSLLEIDPSGMVAVPAFSFPNSKISSQEMDASRASKIFTERAMAGKSMDEFNAEVFGPWIKPSRERYPVEIEASKIAGVPVLIYTPEAGVTPEYRNLVLINVHGGGFRGCFLECGALESIPVAAMSGMKVISIDYREGPDHVFPAATEDVAAVYTELLKSYRPTSVGMFGCSAGGMLVAQSLAWLQTHGLPRVGAAGIFCAGAGSPRGDSAIIGAMLGDGDMPRRLLSQETDLPASVAVGYMSSADPNDPLARPIVSSEVLANFPPTLVISGTRDFALSSALHLHTSLTKLGVDADLHVWEAGRHAFFYDSSIPESAEVVRVIADFFLLKLVPEAKP